MFVGRLVFVCLLWAELTTALLSPLQHSALMRLYDLLGTP